MSASNDQLGSIGSPHVIDANDIHVDAVDHLQSIDVVEEVLHLPI
ncbi:MAG TPA: hypothetical protein VGU03_12610 [Frateuria sp.]|nr:hypothetical protein [Frateuria sp.]